MVLNVQERERERERELLHSRNSYMSTYNQEISIINKLKTTIQNVGLISLEKWVKSNNIK